MARRGAGDEGDTTLAVIAPHREALAALCRRFGVRRLDLFGSAVQGRFDPATSDLDFIADFANPGAPGYAARYLAFAETLEALFGRPVDVLTERMIGSPDFRATVERTRRRVYDERGAVAAR